MPKMPKRENKNNNVFANKTLSCYYSKDEMIEKAKAGMNIADLKRDYAIDGASLEDVLDVVGTCYKVFNDNEKEKKRKAEEERQKTEDLLGAVLSLIGFSGSKEELAKKLADGEEPIAAIAATAETDVKLVVGRRDYESAEDFVDEYQGRNSHGREKMKSDLKVVMTSGDTVAKEIPLESLFELAENVDEDSPSAGVITGGATGTMMFGITPGNIGTKAADVMVVQEGDLTVIMTKDQALEQLGLKLDKHQAVAKTSFKRAKLRKDWTGALVLDRGGNNKKK